MSTKDDKTNDQQRETEFAKFENAVGSPGADPIMIILRSHLFAEALMERLILVSLPRGDKVLESGGLSFAQKLVLVESLDVLPDHITSALRGLNKVRNQCAHNLGKEISEADVTRIGSPLGKAYSEMREEVTGDMRRLLNGVISRICGYVACACTIKEQRAAAGAVRE